MNENMDKTSLDISIVTFLFVVAVVILSFVSLYFLKLSTASDWLGILIILFAFFAFLGKLIKGRWTGILIDERNEMSLSRFQMVMWTLILLSAFFAIALSRISNPSVDPNLALDIGVPEQLWVLIGVSTVSLVGSPLILSRMKLKTPDETKLNTDTTTFTDQLKENDMDHIGTVCTRNSSDNASFYDIFTGDEIADCSYVNLAKVQMFFFTILIGVVYCVLLLDLMIKPGNPVITGFPPLSDGLIALLAISHGGYLTEKAVPSTPTTYTPPSQTTASPAQNNGDSASAQTINPPSPETIAAALDGTTGMVNDPAVDTPDSLQTTEGSDSPPME
ncbi:MAG TPA: hypothetical protein VK426_08250 [Methanobacterium sp.]|nr:hypothetical protein [Methanobacterium sp.]